MKRVLVHSVVLLASILGAQVSCAQTADSLDEETVTLRFVAEVGGSPFACGHTYEGIGLGGSKITPQDLRFYVSQVELISDQGTAASLKFIQDDLWQYKNVSLLDFEDGTGSCRNGNSGLNSVVSGTVPKGHYTGVRFTIGVPFELDHIDATTAPSPLNMTAMLWSWQGGYRFVRAEVELAGPKEGRPISPNRRQGSEGGMGMSSNGFPIHIGSTGCKSGSGTTPPTEECLHPNRSTITLSRFDPSTDVIVFDLATLLKGVDLSGATPQKFPGCMSFESNETCASVMRAFGLPFRDLPVQPQVVFSVRKSTDAYASGGALLDPAVPVLSLN